ncbi:hypothetical protein GDO86_013111 [Hymenochirus boettgeri]|uniref:Uncharacterized protein n=1 Tax=Hymenochirus boettgeri TaxID=247094 RepID=A0A8T2IX55_9PIPI|nr:hypothetical protein GDO86_013111 [Hymenochirus boettgeri]
MKNLWICCNVYLINLLQESLILHLGRNTQTVSYVFWGIILHKYLDDWFIIIIVISFAASWHLELVTLLYCILLYRLISSTQTDCIL